jgi:hypothetical protein
VTQQNHVFYELAGSDAGRQYARLGSVLDLVRHIVGEPALGRDRALDESARVSGAYDVAAPLVRRRFDTLVAEASALAAAGLDALAASADPHRRPDAAAARLAEELDVAMADLKKLLRA